MPIALASGNIPRQREVWQRRQSDVMRPPYASFQHSSAPHWHSGALANIVNPFGHCEPSYAAEFNINNLAGAETDGCLRLIFVVNTLVEADWRVQFLLQFDVTVEI